MSLAVIIVNFRTPTLTLDCLSALAPQIEQLPGARVIVVDNGSGDGSVPILQAEGDRRHWNWLEVLPLPVNLGFAAGNNRGITQAGDVEYVLLLNSDTIVHEGCLAHCMNVMRNEPMIGAMSCLLLNSDGSPQVTARRFSPPTRQYVCALGLPWRLPWMFSWADPEDSWDRRSVRRDVDWIGGAFLFCRGDLLRTLGGFDEDFFFYGEDYELCHRIHRAGYRIHYDPRVAITHLGGGSSDPALLPSPFKQRHEWRGRYLVYRKCHGRIASWVLRGLDVVNYGIANAVHRMRGKRPQPRNQKSVSQAQA